MGPEYFPIEELRSDFEDLRASPETDPNRRLLRRSPALFRFGCAARRSRRSTASEPSAFVLACTVRSRSVIGTGRESFGASLWQTKGSCRRSAYRVHGLRSLLTFSVPAERGWPAQCRPIRL